MVSETRESAMPNKTKKANGAKTPKGRYPKKQGKRASPGPGASG